MLAYLAITTSSVAIVGFGLDSVIEIGASIVVIWELSGTGRARQQRALRLIGAAFIVVALYLLAQSAAALITQHRPADGTGGIIWTGITALVMFTLATGKTRTGKAMNNPVLLTEGRVTVIDGLLAVAVLVGLTLDALFGWWWADPLASLVIVYYAIREAIRHLPQLTEPDRQIPQHSHRHQAAGVTAKLHSDPSERGRSDAAAISDDIAVLPNPGTEQVQIGAPFHGRFLPSDAGVARGAGSERVETAGGADGGPG